VTLGLARTGTSGSHFSGDLFFAGSVANAGAITPGFRSLFPDAAGRYDQVQFIPWGFLDGFYEAVVQSTEEAVVNCLVANTDMTGFRGHRSPALPVERVLEILGRHQRVTRTKSQRRATRAGDPGGLDRATNR
jgi:D-aminopeptidase